MISARLRKGHLIALFLFAALLPGAARAQNSMGSTGAILMIDYSTSPRWGAGEITLGGETMVGLPTINQVSAVSSAPASLPTTLNLAPTAEEVEYDLLGDADLNGIVSGVDFSILAANFNQAVEHWDQSDFNYAGVVSGVDFGQLAADLNQNPAALSAADLNALEAFAAANGLLADVPEPASTASLVLVGLLALAIVPRRLVAR